MGPKLEYTGQSPKYQYKIGRKHTTASCRYNTKMSHGGKQWIFYEPSGSGSMGNRRPFFRPLLKQFRMHCWLNPGSKCLLKWTIWTMGYCSFALKTNSEIQALHWRSNNCMWWTGSLKARTANSTTQPFGLTLWPNRSNLLHQATIANRLNLNMWRDIKTLALLWS